MESNNNLEYRSYEGPTEYAQRCLRIGDAVLAVIELSTEPVVQDSTVLRTQLHDAINLIAANAPEAETILLLEASDRYERKAAYVADLYERFPSDEALYYHFVQEKPVFPIRIERTAIGAHIYCGGIDYVRLYALGRALSNEILIKALETDGCAISSTAHENYPYIVAATRIKDPLRLIEYSVIPRAGQTMDIASIRSIEVSDRSSGVVSQAFIETMSGVSTIMVVPGNDSPTEYLSVSDTDEAMVCVGAQPVLFSKKKLIFEQDDQWKTRHIEVKVGSPTLASNNSDSGITAYVPVAAHEKSHLLYATLRPESDGAFWELHGIPQVEVELVFINFVLNEVLEPDIRDEYLAMLYNMLDSNDYIQIAQLLAELIRTSSHYDYISRRQLEITSAIGMLSGSAPDYVSANTLRSIEADIKENLVGLLLDESSSAIKMFCENNPQFAGTANVRKLVALLASHPMRRWPVMLKAVDRYLKNAEIA